MNLGLFMPSSAFSSRLRLTALAGLLVIAGCRKAPITSYTIPHEAETVAKPADNMASQAVPAASGAPEILWTLPPDWTYQPDQTGMRKGSFAVKDKDGHEAVIAVTVFPGDVGGDLANINRWRGQVQLPPIGDADLASVMTETALPAGTFKRVDLTGSEAGADAAHEHSSRLIGAWLKQDNRTWFFKMIGEASLVDTQRTAFDGFLKSIHFNDAVASSGPASVEPPPVMNAPASGELTWTAPSSWETKPLGTMRKASYTVGGQADFSIISFPGQAGGDLANVNRWRGQVQLPPLTEEQLPAETQSLTSGSLTFTLVDFAGQSKAGPTRLVGAILAFGDQSYFFKLMGPDAVVAGAKPEFIAFLKSVNAR